MFKNDGVKVAQYVWDFAVDGGTIAVHQLANKSGKSLLPIGALVKSVTAKVLTAVAGVGLTMTWGNTTAATGYSGAANAVGVLILGATFDGKETIATPGAHLWVARANVVPSADKAKPFLVAAAADANFQIEIAGGAATAGKIEFLVEYFNPSA